MRSRQALRNVAAGVSLQIVSALAGFVVPRLLIVAYGSCTNGLISSIKSFMYYLNLVETGIGTSAIVALYAPLATDDKNTISAILSAAQRFYNKAGTILAGLIVVLAVVYPSIVNHSVGFATAFLMVIIVGVSSLSHYFLMGRYRVLLTADQRSYIVALNQAGAVIISTAACVCLIRLNVNVVLLQGVVTLIYVAQSFTLMLYVRRIYPFVRKCAVPSFQARINRWDAMVHQLGFVLTSNSPIVLITIMCGLSEVSVYVVHYMIISAVTMFLLACSNGMTAGFGELMAKEGAGSTENAFTIYEHLFLIALTWVYTCTAILFIPFIAVYAQGFVDANYCRPALVVLMMIAGVFYCLRFPYLTMVNAAGKFRETRAGALIEPCIVIVTGAVLATVLGVKGVLVAMGLASLYRTTDVALYFSRHIGRRSFGVILGKVGLNAACAIVAALPFMVGSVSVRPHHWIAWFIDAGAVSTWVLVVVLAGNGVCYRRVTAECVSRLTNALCGRVGGSSVV